MKKTFLIVLLACSSSVQAQQVNTGMVMDNYFSANWVHYNPSTIVDSRTKLGLLYNMNTNLNSNYFKKDYIIYAGEQGKLVDGRKKGFEVNSMNIDIINFKYEFDPVNAVGYSLRFRSFQGKWGIPTIWNEASVQNYKENEVGVLGDLSNWNFSECDFTEHAFTYSRKIFDQGERVLKGGATFKMLNGLGARYFYANAGSIEFPYPDYDLAEITGLDAGFGESEGDAPLKYKNRGVGLDLGFTYEIRPDYKKQYYDMDGEKDIIRYDINKYKMKLMGSITDLGFIRFMKDTLYKDFTNTSSFVNASNLVQNGGFFSGFGNSPYQLVYTQMQQSGTVAAEQSEKFKMNLPTTLHLSVDYLIDEFKPFKKADLYVSYNMSMPLIGAWDKTRMSYVFLHTITPRIENKNFSVMLPLSQDGTGHGYMGLAGRYSFRNYSAYIGSNNVGFLLGKKASLTRSYFIGFAYSILHNVPADRDKDKVSDRMDECPDDKGTWEFRGCPDSDGDGIIDSEDYCIYDPGPLKTRGCPDTDGDGIIDMNDMCPDIPGLGVHFGCPDRDGDGVIDVADQCPDVPGIELNNGCPFENPGCCMDNDGDGVSNNVDKCPDHAGSVYNDGCPVDNSNLNKINLQDNKEELDPNHTGEQIRVIGKNDTISNLFTSKTELNKMIAKKNVIKDMSVYFDHDQSNISETEHAQLMKFVNDYLKDKSVSIMVVGLTDRDGSLDYNLVLSRKRAETVMRKLVDAGFPENKITVYYYGETKSLHKGSYTEEQKKQDRRVDIKIIKD
jgi:outer membrane protein OmpA-like peptidoglycan-associated protein